MFVSIKLVHIISSKSRFSKWKHFQWKQNIKVVGLDLIQLDYVVNLQVASLKMLRYSASVGNKDLRHSENKNNDFLVFRRGTFLSRKYTSRARGKVWNVITQTNRKLWVCIRTILIPMHLQNNQGITIYFQNKKHQKM